MYVCPNCQQPLDDMSCRSCGREFVTKRGFPIFLIEEDVENGDASVSTEEVVEAYDKIYTEHEDVWEDQGRPAEFIRYFAGRLMETEPGLLLEVGCGEGILLAATDANEKYALDVSTKALERTQARSPKAHLSIALAEHLPFPDGTFDVVGSVGVMEHFLDDRAASAEIARVLKPGGRYYCLIHLRQTTGEKVKQKVSEYVWPPHPIRFTKWLVGKKALRPIHQPIRHLYSIDSAREVIESAGLVVKEVSHLGVDPTLPLVGPHGVIYVAER
jgi:ubiquinone/menaquinone biosynthesis C-methylase UbiE